MPLLVTNETNLEKIQQEFAKAKSEILICSAWITSGMLKRVLNSRIQEKIRQGKLSFRMIIRLGEPTDVKITDQGVFELIEELGDHAQLRYHKKLHAKMFVADENWAMIGSFNLTGGGFGDLERPGTNPEAGFEFREQAAITEVRQRFEDIWNAEDIKTIDENLLGFVLSPSSSLEFYMLGIKELPMNMFIQVKHSEEQYLIGNIANSEKHDLNYIESDFSNIDFRRRYELMDSFGKSNLGGIAKALATLPRESQQLKVARVKVTNKVTLKDGRLVPGGLTFSTIPPNVASEVYKADKQMLEQIFNQEDFAPAVLHANPDIEVGFDPEELTTKHFSVFGSTGSGKSYFVKYLISHDLYNWFCKKKKGRIIIFDTHNEYTAEKDMPGAFVNDTSKFISIDAGKYRARLVRDIDDLEEACDIKFSSRDEKNFIERMLRKAVQSAITDKQFLSLLEKESAQKGAHQTIDIKKEFKVLERAIQSSFYQYIDSIQAIAKNSVEEDLQTGKINLEDLKDDKGKPSDTAIKSKLIYDRTKELFDKLDPGVKKILKQQVIRKNIYDKIENYFERDVPLVSHDTLTEISNSFQNGKVTIEELDIVNQMQAPKVYKVDPSGIDEEITRHNLTASILTQIFNAKKKDPKMMDTVFVIEEAHNFAPEGGGRNNPASRIIQKIAAEGRKFRLGLIVITQRPAYVSKGVLSQCSTQAIFRLININDLNQIKEVVEGVGEAEISQLPYFETGQAIFAGVGIRQPVIVRGKEINKS